MENRYLRHFIIRTLIGAIPAILLLAASFYYWFGIRPYISGDLGQLGKIPFDKEYNTSNYRPRLSRIMVFQYTEGERATAVSTIGDSFSQQGPVGYQNYLGNLLGDTVCNIRLDPTLITPAQGTANLLAQGFFREHPEIKTWIIEDVEHEFVQRWQKIDFEGTSKESLILSPDPDAVAESPHTYQDIMTTIFRQGTDWIRLALKVDRNPVYKVGLKSPLFTLPDHESDLYFYRDDLTPTELTSEEKTRLLSNLREMKRRLAEQGVRMICFVVPDKLETYRPFLVEDNFKPRTTGDSLLSLDISGVLVFPRDEVRNLVVSGEKDVFMGDDTHWSYKAASAAARKLHERITEESNTK